MKIIVFLLITLPAIAQNGFKTEKGKIVWEHFFAEDANLKTLVEGNEKMKIVSADDTSCAGKAEGIVSTIGANSIRLQSDANFDFTITKVAGGYTVKVINYVFLEKYGPSQMRILPGSLEKYYLEYGKIRNSDKTKTELGYVDNFLTGLFVPQPAPAPADAKAATTTTTTTTALVSVNAAAVTAK